MTETHSPYSAIEERLGKKFPGLLSADPRKLVRMARDPHSLLHGELIRWRMLLKVLDEESDRARRMQYSDEKRMENLRWRLHDYFVGSLSRAEGRETLPMYYGSPSDFQKNARIWKESCVDVEKMYEYLLGYLPRYLEIGGKKRDLAQRLRLPQEVREEHDPILLIERSRRRSASVSAWVRHCAQAKLVLAQTFFEYRRYGYAREQLEERATEMKRMIEHQLFKSGSKEKVRIVAKLDAEKAYACSGITYLSATRNVSDASDTHYAVEANRYTVRLPSEEEIPVVFSIRPKRFPVLKSIVKDIRFPQLAYIGDGIAMAFVVDDESSVDKIVDEVRRVIVPCPGSVCDQDSNLGWRRGRALDVSNGNSSERFRAMKYNALVADQIVEVQFVSTKDFIDAKCRRDDAHHGCYKARQYCLHVFPVLFPEPLVGVPWPAEFVSRAAATRPYQNEEIWQQIVDHVYARQDVFSI